ncbi:MAG: 3-keto-5-aminohexanoate cleavage protein [Microbacteriaceae bacterium]
MEKVIIEVALNEYVTTAENPHVPLTIDEIVRDAVECADAGASIVHFHPRDPACAPGVIDMARAQDTAFYREAMRRIRRERDVIAYPTNSFQTHVGPDEEPDLFPHVRELATDPQAGLETFVAFIGAANAGWWHPEARRWVTDRAVYMTHAETAWYLKWCAEAGFRTQFGVREPGHIRHIYHYQDMGLVPDPVVVHLNFSDGPPFGPLPAVQGIQAFLSAVPEGKRPPQWFVHNFANRFNAIDAHPESHRMLNLLAIAMGGHVRTGIGDLPRWDGAALTNAEMVGRYARIAREMGREIATADEARQILGIRPRPAAPAR